MKKNFTYSIIVGVVVILLVAPGISFASTRKGPEGTRNDGAQFCATLTNRIQQAGSNFDEKHDKLEIRRHDQLNKKSAQRAERDTKLAEQRQDGDVKRASHISALESKATTDTQKAAVLKFKTVLDTALATRRSAIDTAMTTFRAGIDGVTTNRVNTVDAAIAQFNTACQAAFAKAQADCAAGVAPQTAKATFEASMKSAQTAFQTAKAGFVKKADVTALSSARKTAITQAMDTFKKTMESARTELQAAFR